MVHRKLKSRAIAVQWRRPEAYTCRHMVHRKLKSRASCPMEETRGTDL